MGPGPSERTACCTLCPATMTLLAWESFSMDQDPLFQRRRACCLETLRSSLMTMSFSAFRPMVVIDWLIEKVLPASGPVRNLIEAREGGVFSLLTRLFLFLILILIFYVLAPYLLPSSP